jgi:hypothetical protein
MTTPARTPSTHLEGPEGAAARGILLWIIGQAELDTEDRLAALEALGALEDHLPAHIVLAPVEEQPGSLQDARRLLEQATDSDVTGRALTGVCVALGHLRHRIEAR